MQALPKRKLSEKNKAAIRKLHARGLKPGMIGKKLKLHGQQVAGYTRTLIFLGKLEPHTKPKDDMYWIGKKLDSLAEEIRTIRAALERGMVFQMPRRKS